ncbi:MAG TPA: acetyltransferase [Streptosporangiaceae bacterium]|nr:acetyltransferase [Streptosporangiaceae bacterium]
MPKHPLQESAKAERVVIVGTGELAAIAFDYLTHDSPHEVVAFSADASYLPQDGYCGLPAVPLDKVASAYPPAVHRVFVAVSATRLNRLRRRLFNEVRAAGFTCISYVSSQAFVWPSVPIGANSLVFESCTIQRGASVGDNVILWSGACVAHNSVIEDDCFLAPQAAVAGFSRVGSGSFLGVNSCVADAVTIGADCVVGAGAVVIADAKSRQVYVGNPARATGKDSFETFRVTGTD